MSQNHYNKKWDVAQSDLARILRIERPLKRPTPDKNRKSSFEMVSYRYISFVMIYKKLIKCYDYMVHPQKRILIGRCVEGVTARILELREEMIRLDLCEYSFLMDILQDLKITPRAIEVPMSKFIGLQRVSTIRKRTNMLDYILASLNTDVTEQVVEIFFTVHEAVLLIQKNERAYQARRRVKAVKRRKRGVVKSSKDFIPLDQLDIKKVTLIQAVMRGFRSRKGLGATKREAAIALGMRDVDTRNTIQVTETKVLSSKFKEANDNNDIYITDTILNTERLLEKKGPSMAEDMKREITQWVLECRNVTGQFPMLPEEEKGGSAFLFQEKSMEDLEDEMDELQEQLEKGGKKKGGEKKEKKEKKADKKKKGGLAEEFVMKPSKVIDTVLVPEAQEYGLLWKGKEESSYNRKQRYDKNLMVEDITKNVEAMVRLTVDELMREELMRLTVGIDRQKRPKEKKDKKKDKKKKGKKGKKGKKMKDLTPGVPIEDLYKDLVVDDIIKKVHNIPIKNFIGDYTYMSEDDYQNLPMTQDLGDVRKMLIDFGVMAMSSEGVHNVSPFYKSLILVGPHGSGKKMLVHAMAHELGASLFDLSAMNIDGKYEGKQGQQMLIHLVMKVGKAMEPSIIFIGECDQMFSKKLSPEVVALKPNRLKKDLSKAMKFITAEDRIILVGTSKFPFKAAMGPMMKLYQRLIFIYPPRHASRFQLWKKLIEEHNGNIPDEFDITALAHVTRGYTAGDIKNAVIEVLTGKRIQKQTMYPIRTQEFVQRIATFDPVYVDEMEEFDKWMEKTPLRKKKKKVMKLEEEGNEVIGLL